MFPYLNVFGRSVPTYSLLTLLGVVLAGAYLYYRCRKTGGKFEDSVYTLVFSLIGMLLGAKILYLITVFPQLVRDLPYLFSNPKAFLYVYVSTGMVFYGGLLGAIGGCLAYLRYMKCPFAREGGVFVHIIPLIGAFGRLGCFAEGCCYGRETSGPLGVVFAASSIAPNDVPLLPTQLFEAGFDLLLFAFLLWQYRRGVGAWRQLGSYLCLYAVFRFVLEFFRGDAMRGFVGPLSTSQCISIFVFAWGLFLLLRREKRPPEPALD